MDAGIQDPNITKNPHGDIIMIKSTKRRLMKTMVCLYLMDNSFFDIFTTRNTSSLAKAGSGMPGQANGFEGEGFSVLEIVATYLGIFNWIPVRSEICGWEDIVTQVSGKTDMSLSPINNKGGSRTLY